MSRVMSRRGTTAQWTSANPVLSSGEMGYDSTLKTFKVGDGATAWATLPTLVSPLTVLGPAVAVDERLARFDTATGKLIQSSVATLTDAGLLTTPAVTTTGDVTVGGTLHMLKAIRRAVLGLAATTALALTGESFVDVTAGATSRTITLPATTTPGYIITIMKVDSGVGTVVVAGTINGVVNRTLSAQYSKVTVRSTAVSGTWLEV